MKSEMLCEMIEVYMTNHPEGITGGNLHIVLSDGNVDDSSINFCMQQILAEGDHLGYAIAKMLLEFPEDKRWYMYEAEWKPTFLSL